MPVLAVFVFLGCDALERAVQTILNRTTACDVPLLVYLWNIRSRIGHLDRLATISFRLGFEKGVTESKN